MEVENNPKKSAHTMCFFARLISHECRVSASKKCGGSMQLSLNAERLPLKFFVYMHAPQCMFTATVLVTKAQRLQTLSIGPCRRKCGLQKHGTVQWCHPANLT